jgi:hypothetical protein
MHEDLGEWKTRPHKTHRCLFCKNEWTPFPYTTVGVATPPLPHEPVLFITDAVFRSLHEYSCTLPTAPRSGRYWRRRWPYQMDDQDPRAVHHLAVALSMPNDPPGQISLFWRRLSIIEWDIAREASKLLELGA